MLQQPREIAPAIDDADNLNEIDRPSIRVGVGLVENEIRGMNQHAGGSTDISPSWAETRSVRETIDLLRDRPNDLFGRSLIVDGYRKPDFGEFILRTRSDDDPRHAGDSSGGPWPCE